jgi:hypothetical protein
MPGFNADFDFPSWQSTARSENATHLEIDGLRVKYTGPGHQDADAASVRTNIPISQSTGLFFYEVTIMSKGRHGYIGVGFCIAEFQADRLPGWEPHSYGYHGDDGHAFQGSGKGRAYGPTYTTGDVIGALWNRIDRTISFFKNGVSLGVAFSDVLEDRLYPTVGLRTTNEEVRANFGTDTFVTDVEEIQADVRQQLEAEIAATSIQHNAKPSYMLEELVFGYLTHSGITETARLAARDMMGGARQVSAFDVESVKRRREISNCVAAGDVERAIDLTEQLAPGTLEASPSVLLRLHIQIFIELVRQKQDSAALEYGHQVLKPICNSSGDRELLSEAVTLLGYHEPALSPLGHLLSERHKLVLASDLNRAILSHQGGQEKSPLERLMRQLAVTQQELLRTNHPAAAAIDLQKHASLT